MKKLLFICLVGGLFSCGRKIHLQEIFLREEIPWKPKLSPCDPYRWSRWRDINLAFGVDFSIFPQDQKKLYLLNEVNQRLGGDRSAFSLNLWNSVPVEKKGKWNSREYISGVQVINLGTSSHLCTSYRVRVRAIFNRSVKRSMRFEITSKDIEGYDMDERNAHLKAWSWR